YVATATAQSGRRTRAGGCNEWACARDRHIQYPGFRGGTRPVRYRTADAGSGNSKDQEMKRQSTYPLRLPNSIKAEVEKLAKADGISINQFVATAVAEKLAAMNTATYFAERRARADFAAFDKLMRRKGGE